MSGYAVLRDYNSSSISSQPLIESHSPSCLNNALVAKSLQSTIVGSFIPILPSGVIIGSLKDLLVQLKQLK